MREYLPGRIEEHHDQLAPGQRGLHHEAAPGLGDVAGLLQADVPARVAHQAVGVAELQLRAGRPRPAYSGEVDSSRIIGCSCAALTSVARSLRARLVLARQAGRLDVAGVVHAQQLRPWRSWPRRTPAGRPGSAAERMRGAVLGRHQRQMQHLARASAACRRAGASGCPSRCRRRPAVIVSISSSGRLRLGDDQRGHQLGDRRDRQHGLGVLAEQHLVGVLVDHQGDAGLQVQRVVAWRAGRASWPNDGGPAPARTRGRRACARLAACATARSVGLAGRGALLATCVWAASTPAARAPAATARHQGQQSPLSQPC